MSVTESPAAITANAGTLTRLSGTDLFGKRLVIEALEENMQSDGSYGRIKICGPSGSATRFGRTLKPGEWIEVEAHESPRDRVNVADWYFVTDLNACGVRWLLEY